MVEIKALNSKLDNPDISTTISCKSSIILENYLVVISLTKNSETTQDLPEKVELFLQVDFFDLTSAEIKNPLISKLEPLSEKWGKMEESLESIYIEKQKS